MKIKIIVTAGIAASSMLWPGCSYVTALRISELQAVAAHTDSLKTQLAGAQELLLKEQKGQAELLRLMRADQQVRFSELERKISSLESNLSDNQYKLSQIDEKTQAIKTTWEEKLKSDSLVKTTRIAETENLFQIAYGDFAAGRYDLAFSGFRDIVKQYPESDQADEASYWSAECYYARKEYDPAESYYLDYLKAYPSGKKRCAALYKLGQVYEHKKKPKSRDIVYRKLIDSCPNTPEAQNVRDALEKSNR